MAADRPRPDPISLHPEDLRAYAAWLRRLASSLVGSGALAEDVAQEAWTAAVAHPPARAEAWRSWLRAVLHNCVRGWARADRSRGRRESAAAELAEEALPSSEELLVRHEALAFVAEEVRRLREPYRSTVLLCYAEEVPPSEIARRQGVPPGTVRWRLKQGLDELRRRLGQRYGRDRQAWIVALGLGPAAPAASAPAGVTPAGMKVAALALAIATGLSLALTFSRSAPEENARLAPDEPPASARLADAGPQIGEPGQPWSDKTAPLLVEAQLPDEIAPNDRLTRM
jgi:RNA polymerase sigma factor (sigma-70 family)